MRGRIGAEADRRQRLGALRGAGFALGLALLLVGSTGCGLGTPGETSSLQPQTASSCMLCHNGSLDANYSGPGIENPHPFPGAESMDCTVCHGGDGSASDQFAAHVPPPPQIGDREKQKTNALAFFNRRTLAGIDKFPDYTVDGKTYTAIDYLQFINPGDLRVTQLGRGCGECHAPHSELVTNSLLATSAGVLSGASFSAGIENYVAENQGLHLDTAADLGFRAVSDPNYSAQTAEPGQVPRLIEHPVHSQHNSTHPNKIHNNQAYSAALLANQQLADGRVISDSELARLFHEQVAFTCGDCHLGSAGANNRAGDFRSSGCSACHMPYSLGGRTGSKDPHMNPLEPLNPDNIASGERSHVRAHRIVSVARTLDSGVHVGGIDDHTCAGCHQGSNRTVMQYWGIRLDQNQDVRRNRQYPANPVSFTNTKDDPRLFDPEVGNNTFNGRNFHQYLSFEDYDGDGRDDTPPDVHYEAGMGCIDCHGSHELHGGTLGSGLSPIRSRMEQAVAISCESCHGGVDHYAETVAGTNYLGQPGQHLTDTRGNVLRHVRREADGHVYLYSKVTGAKHFVPQTRDVTVDTGVTNPFDETPLYSVAASYAMGRIDGDPSTGLGPQQVGNPHTGFSHTDRMDCATCHSAWTNTCMGCHLEGEYNTGNNFSNITGERIVFRERFADFVYQSPVPFQLGINSRGKIAQVSANTKTFFRYRDLNGDLSQVFAFSDRKGQGNSPAAAYPALSHNALMAHSIRGKVGPKMEGPRYCVACHLTENALENWGPEYEDFRQAIASGNYDDLDWELLKTHIGRNTGNQLDSPFWVHMVAGLGSGLFVFDAQGRPVNPLDTNPDRKPFNQAPASFYDPAGAVFDLDRLVRPDGISQASSSHALLDPALAGLLRDGATDPGMAGPLGATLLQRLADPVHGVVLDSWYDADGLPRGQVQTFLAPGPPSSD